MKLALNLLAIQPDRPIGVERFTKNVVGSAEFSGFDEILIVTSRGVGLRDALGEAFAAANPGTVVRTVKARSRPGRFLSETLLLSLYLWRYDVVLSVNNFGPWLGKRSQRRIGVVHDVWFLCESYEGKALPRFLFSMLIRLQVARTGHLITVSERSRNDIRKALSLPGRRISVVPNCIKRGQSFRGADAQDRDAGGEYFLVFGSDRANKNVARTIEAFSSFRSGAAGSGMKLVCVGKYRAEYVDRIQKAYPELGGALDIRGFVEEEELHALISGSRGIVFLSLHEGFGIPVIEALAEGKPVLVSRGTVCEEIAGEAGVAVDGRDVREIVRGLERLARPAGEGFRELAARAVSPYVRCDRSARKLVDVVAGV